MISTLFKHHVLSKPILVTALLLPAISCEQTQNNKLSTDRSFKNKNILLSDLVKLNPIQVPLSEPKPGEWAYIHHEAHQSLKKYIASDPVRPTKKRNKIYIKPIGIFDSTDDHIFNALTAYTQLFFGLETVLLSPVSDSIVPNHSKRIHHEIAQLHTKYILNEILTKSIPQDAIVYTAITSKDLYPKAGWNYVFGQANLKEKVGVLSMYRFKTELKHTNNYAWYLNRMLKTTTHEMSHIFSLKHCTRYKCLMNGSNSLPEADTKPSWLCSDCLAKLIWCTNNDISNRYDTLIAFLEKKGYSKKVAFYRKSQDILWNDDD